MPSLQDEVVVWETHGKEVAFVGEGGVGEGGGEGRSGRGQGKGERNSSLYLLLEKIFALLACPLFGDCMECWRRRL